MLKEEKISLLVLIIVVGFAMAVVYHYVMGHYLGKPWPANTFLHTPAGRFFDFHLVVRDSAALDPFGATVEGYGFEGAPFGQFVGYLFSLVKPAWLQLTIFFGSFFVASVLFVKHHLYGLKSRLASQQLLAVFAIVFLTYPVLFAVDRANFVLLVVPCLFLFAFTYERQKYKASTVFLALAIALKPYAAIFAIVYFLDKRFKDGLLLVFNTLFLTVLSLALFKDGLFVETQRYLHALSNAVNYFPAPDQPAFTSDLFASLTVGLKFVGDKFGTTMYLPAHPVARIVYAAITVIVFIYFVIYLWEKPRPLWKVLAVLTILLVLLPFDSFDYRLTCLFVPMLMYLGSNEKTRNDLLIVILWGLLLVPKNYYRLDSPQNIGQNIGMVINPLLLIALLVCIIPDAFSISGVASPLRFLYTRLRSTWPARKLENPRSS